MLLDGMVTDGDGRCCMLLEAMLAGGWVLMTESLGWLELVGLAVTRWDGWNQASTLLCCLGVHAPTVARTGTATPQQRRVGGGVWLEVLWEAADLKGRVRY